MSIPTYIYGPVQTGSVAIFTNINGQFYVLRSPSGQGTGFPPYFGLADGTTNYTQLTLNLPTSSQGYSMITSNAQGMHQGAALNTAVFDTPSTGQFNFQYTYSTASGLPLLAGQPLQMIVAGTPLTFKWQSPTNEASSFNSSGCYVPTYDGDVSSYIIIPINGIPNGNCSVTTQYGPYISYSNQGQTTTFFTTSDLCTNGINNPICGPGQNCGTSISGVPCYGPCSTTVPSSGGFHLSEMWIILIIIAIVVIIFLIIAGIYFARRNSQK